MPEGSERIILSKSELTRKIVYFDQKCWIELGRMLQSEQKIELVEKIFDASEKDKIIFPLSFPHLQETMKISDEKRKDKLASLMVRLSKGYSFQPYFSTNLKLELQNIVLNKLGFPQVNIRDHVLKQGISNLIGGGKPTLTYKKGAKELPENIERKLLELLESPKTLEFCLKQKLPKSLLGSKKELTEIFEKNRQKLSELKDNNLRQRAFLAWNIGAVIIPELAKILYANGLPKDFFAEEFSTEECIMKFLASTPTALCLFTLIFQRDQQLQRPIQKNDFNDIWFLTLALPYSDIVATEKMWASIAKQAKLDVICKTEILSSINELAEFL